MPENNFVVLTSDEGRVEVMRMGGGPAQSLTLDASGAALTSLPCVADMVVVDSEAIVVTVRPLYRARVRIRGGVATLDVPQQTSLSLEVPVGHLGLGEDHHSELDALNATNPASSVLGIVPGDDGSLAWTWTHPGGPSAWLKDREVIRRRRPRRERLKRERSQYQPERAGGDDVFVNPYTFVPLPQSVTRGRPRGHASMGGDGLSGWFDVHWDLLSEYVFPQDHPAVDQPAVVEIPGSSVKGAVRAVHEVLADGCMRVFQPDLLPVHRETEVRHSQWALAIVNDVDLASGRVLGVQMCSEVVWVDATQAHRTIPAAALHSGLTVDLNLGTFANLDAATTKGPGGRRRLRPGVRLTSGDRWVLHLTDANARLRHRPYYVAAGRLDSTTRRVEPSAWTTFRDLAADGADWVAARRDAKASGLERPPSTYRHAPGSPGWPAVDVTFDGTAIGRRRSVEGWLSRGDTVWVNAGRGPVTGMKPALLWRKKGRYPAGERVGAAPEEREGRPTTSVLPCVYPDELCPTCRVFGSTDVSGRRGDVSAQRAYGGHVRFAPLRSDKPVVSRERLLPPLGAPRPSSGMFYLSHEGIRTQGPGAPDRFAAATEPLSYWGSRLDDGAPRRLAGRKFYWHGVSPEPRYPRHVQRPGTADTQGRAAHVVDAGTTFVGRVWFDNLDEIDLGLVLASVQPALALRDLDGGHTGPNRQAVLDGRTFAVHLGGGRPLGYGTVVPSIVEGSLTVHTARSRYLGQPPPTTSAAEYVDAARHACSVDGTGHREDAPAPWYALASVLAAARVPADRIWYPPAQPWSRRTSGPEDAPEFTEAFDESYHFFSVYRGGGIGNLANMEPMQPLPLATSVDQSLPIAEKNG